MHMPNPRFAKYFLMSRRYEFMMSISAKARFALTLCLLLPATFARADIAATSSLLPARPPASGLFVAPMRMPVAKTTAIPTPPRPMTQAPTMQAIVAGTPGQQCRQAIRAAEMAAGIPSQLMAAIGRIESGRRDAQGQVDPWPWSINVEGVDHIYETRAEAIAAVRGFQAAGKKSIDVGCMQVNLMFHPTAFASIEQAFEPAANAAYAAHYLKDLFAQTGSWEKATAYYHSATPELGMPYQQKVAAVLPEEQKRLAAGGGNMWTNNVWNTSGAPGGGFRLSNHAEAAKVLPAATGTIGRPLAAYRAAAIPVSGRATP